MISETEKEDAEFSCLKRALEGPGRLFLEPECLHS